jgi:prolyl-tRNA editing enzyme YbaK/EbsC (Cys-tRNA(Pro) deacylase)
MSAKDKFESYLRDNGVEFEAHSHPEAFSAQKVAAFEHVSGKQLAKPVMVVCDGDLVMAVVPAHEKVELGRFKTAAGAGWHGKMSLHRASRTATRGPSRRSETCTTFLPTWTSRSRNSRRSSYRPARTPTP